MNVKKIISAIGYAIVFLLLILDSKNAIHAGAEGISICLQTVIPSLFPFLVICPLLTNRISSFLNLRCPAIERLCGIPQGSEIFLLIGILSGYPIGAQAIEKANLEGILSTQSAKRMLGFCNNAGPAFILGISAALFEKAYIPFVLWAIQIISSLLVSFVLPRTENVSCSRVSSAPLNMPLAVAAALRSMSGICGWVVTFRILLALLQRWALWILPEAVQVTITGFLEITNGCVGLQQIPSSSLRFILCSAFLSFGGLCVWMQTLSVSPILRGGWFFVGRCFHLIFSVTLSYITQFLLFANDRLALHWPVMLLLAILIVIPFFCKKGIAFPHKMLYNKKKSVIEVDYAFSQKDST